MAKRSKTQADRFGDFMAAEIKHGGAVARGTVRRFLDEHAVEITANVVRFRDGVRRTVVQ
jgi:hypothetical protein